MRRAALVFAVILAVVPHICAGQKPKTAEQKKPVELTEEEKEIMRDRELLENLELLQMLDKIQHLELFADIQEKTKTPAEPADKKSERKK